jgi:hypothetical protein
MPLALLQFGWLYLSRAGVLGQRAGARRAEKTKKRLKKGILLFFLLDGGVIRLPGKTLGKRRAKNFSRFCALFSTGLGLDRCGGKYPLLK